MEDGERLKRAHVDTVHTVPLPVFYIPRSSLPCILNMWHSATQFQSYLAVTVKGVSEPERARCGPNVGL